MPCQGVAQEVQGKKRDQEKILRWTQRSPGLSAFSQKRLPKQTTTTTSTSYETTAVEFPCYVNSKGACPGRGDCSSGHGHRRADSNDHQVQH